MNIQAAGSDDPTRQANELSLKNATQGQAVFQQGSLIGRRTTQCTRQAGPAPAYLPCQPPPALVQNADATTPSNEADTTGNGASTPLSEWCVEWYSDITSQHIYLDYELYNTDDQYTPDSTSFFEMQLVEQPPTTGPTLGIQVEVDDYVTSAPSGTTGNPDISGPSTIAGGGVRVDYTTPPVTGATYAWSIESQLPTGTNGVTRFGSTGGTTFTLLAASRYTNGTDPMSVATTSFTLRLIVTVGGVQVKNTTATITVIPSNSDQFTATLLATALAGTHHIAVIVGASTVQACVDGVVVGSTPRTTGSTVFNGSTATFNAYVGTPAVPESRLATTHLRLSNISRYSTPFTPPVPGAITADADTTILYLCDDWNGTQLTDDTGTLNLPNDSPTAPLTYDAL